MFDLENERKLASREFDIEITVEHQTDRLDARFMRGEYTQEQYDSLIKALDKWAQTEFDKLS